MQVFVKNTSNFEKKILTERENFFDIFLRQRVINARTKNMTHVVALIVPQALIDKNLTSSYVTLSRTLSQVASSLFSRF